MDPKHNQHQGGTVNYDDDGDIDDDDGDDDDGNNVDGINYDDVYSKNFFFVGL